MGLFDRKPAEDVFCTFCGGKIKGPKFLMLKTDSGNYVCDKCVTKYHFNDLKSFGNMNDEELQRYTDAVKASELKEQKFVAQIEFPGYPFAIDSTHQWIKFKNFFYVFDIDELEVIVTDLTLDSGDIRGTMQFHMDNLYFPFRNVKIKTTAKGLLKSSQIKNFQETMQSISNALGEIPIISPKEFKKYVKEQKNMLKQDMALLEEYMKEMNEDLNDMDFMSSYGEGDIIDIGKK